MFSICFPSVIEFVVAEGEDFLATYCDLKDVTVLEGVKKF